MLDSAAMVSEVSVLLFPEKRCLEEFYDYFEIRNRKAKLVPSPESFHDALKELSGDDVWRNIAEKTESLFGLPKSVALFDDPDPIRDELEGVDGLAPFFFVFDIMFCEYEGFTLCFISGTNN